MSPTGIVSANPGRSIIANRGDNITLSVTTEAGPGTAYYWIYDPSLNTFCSVDNNTNCDFRS